MIQIPLKSIASPLHLPCLLLFQGGDICAPAFAFLPLGWQSVHLSITDSSVISYPLCPIFTCSLPSCPRPLPSRIGLFDLCHYDPGPPTSCVSAALDLFVSPCVFTGPRVTSSLV